MTGGPKIYAKIDHKRRLCGSQGPKGTQLTFSHSTAVTKPESPKRILIIINLAISEAQMAAAVLGYTGE